MSIDIIPDFVGYQIDWLMSHNDLEFEPVIEDTIVQMLKDTGKSFIDEQAVETSQFDHIAESDRMVSISCGRENDVIYRNAAIEALARMMPRSYTPDGSHPADEEIYKAQEIYVDCIESIEILPAAQPEIIRCKDCKFSHMTNDGRYCKYCDQFTDTDDYGELVEMYFDSNFYCGYAERRTE